MKQRDEITKRDVIGAQTDLLEHFDDDINVDIRDDFTLHITSGRVPSVDFVVMLAAFTEGVLDSTIYTLGTSKAPPKSSTANMGVISGVQLSERVYQWRTTQELAKQKQLEAKSGKTRT
jgi:hypothetical protein